MEGGIWEGRQGFMGIMGKEEVGAEAPFVSGQLLMNVPIMFIVPAHQFLGNVSKSSFCKLTFMPIGYTVHINTTLRCINYKMSQVHRGLYVINACSSEIFY